MINTEKYEPFYQTLCFNDYSTPYQPLAYEVEQFFNQNNKCLDSNFGKKHFLFELNRQEKKRDLIYAEILLEFYTKNYRTRFYC